MLIEDDFLTTNFLTMFLRQKNYDIKTAVDGKQGLRSAEESLPDLIILDLQLPDMEGKDVIQQVAELNPDIPIIVCSAQPEEKQMQFLEEHSNVKDYIVKPFSIEVLLSKIEKI